ncbi:MAG: flagellar export chaperone FliS [Alphaproteobacteria bacterium]|nr:flagellar export chaperone FliS [Alphaproteobacteria bacterium]
MTADASKKYQEQQILSASPAKLVAMLYDKAISCLNEAVQAIEEQEVEKRWKANAKACEIINHMQITLDVKQGGQIAKNLDKLYSFILNRLPRVDIENDPRPARETISLLEPLAESWHTLADQNVVKPAPGVSQPQDSSQPAPQTETGEAPAPAAETPSTPAQEEAGDQDEPPTKRTSISV